MFSFEFMHSFYKDLINWKKVKGIIFKKYINNQIDAYLNVESMESVESVQLCGSEQRRVEADRGKMTLDLF